MDSQAMNEHWKGGGQLTLAEAAEELGVPERELERAIVAEQLDFELGDPECGLEVGYVLIDLDQARAWYEEASADE